MSLLRANAAWRQPPPRAPFWRDWRSIVSSRGQRSFWRTFEGRGKLLRRRSDWLHVVLCFASHSRRLVFAVGKLQPEAETSLCMAPLHVCANSSSIVTSCTGSS